MDHLAEARQLLAEPARTVDDIDLAGVHALIAVAEELQLLRHEPGVVWSSTLVSTSGAVDMSDRERLTQHRKERGELVAAVNAVEEWRPLRSYALRLFGAGLPAALCLWMVQAEVRQRVWERADPGSYRAGILRNQLDRFEAVTTALPEQALLEAVDFGNPFDL